MRRVCHARWVGDPVLELVAIKRLLVTMILFLVPFVYHTIGFVSHHNAAVPSFEKSRTLQTLFGLSAGRVKVGLVPMPLKPSRLMVSWKSRVCLWGLAVSRSKMENQKRSISGMEKNMIVHHKLLITLLRVILRG